MIYHFNFNCISPPHHIHTTLFLGHSFFFSYTAASSFPCRRAHTRTAICPPHPLLTGRRLCALLQSVECHQFSPESAGVEGSQHHTRGSQQHIMQRKKKKKATFFK